MAVRDEQADRNQAAEQRDETARAAERSKDIVTEDDARSREDAETARQDATVDRRAAAQDRLRARENARRRAGP